MWVRIDEIAFSPDCTDEVIDRVRNSAATSHDGEGFRGFRLLVDGANGRALDVSYWDTRNGALAGEADPAIVPAAGAPTEKIRSNIYQLCIDAV